ncbi:MAG: MerR family DNA-binding transcriptional regulator [Alphaproteobacteria bacterium]|nr:MerR family DNA-binding transcriptional regulator [Alphaproteobacteria bacterium]
MKTFSISQLSEEFGITPRAIRFYEDEDLIKPSRQGQSRIYSPRDRARLALILRGKRVGFSLVEIKEMLDLYDMNDGQATQLSHAIKKFNERINSLERQRGDIEQALVELRQSRARLEVLLADKGTPSHNGRGSEAEHGRLIGYAMTPSAHD